LRSIPTTFFRLNGLLHPLNVAGCTCSGASTLATSSCGGSARVGRAAAAGARAGGAAQGARLCVHEVAVHRLGDNARDLAVCKLDEREVPRLARLRGGGASAPRAQGLGWAAGALLTLRLRARRRRVMLPNCEKKARISSS
jgi:hypothetical protein